MSSNMIEVSGIGLAERRVIHMILSDVPLGSRTYTKIIRNLRQAFDLRGAQNDVDEMLDLEQRRAQEMGVPVQMAMVSWHELLEAGYKGETYGCSYRADKTDLSLFKEWRDAKDSWAWRDKPDGTREVLPMPSEFHEALGNLDESMENALA